MAFESAAEFFAMGGHGFYVWLAYGVSLFSLVLLLLAPSFRRRALLKEIQQQQRIEQTRQNGGAQ